VPEDSSNDEAKEKRSVEADKARRKREEEIVKFKADLLKQQEDQEADSDIKKIELARERHLVKLEALKLSDDEEKAQAILLNQIYDEKVQVIKDEKAEEDKVKAEEVRIADLEAQLELDGIELQRILDKDDLMYSQQTDLKIAFLEKQRLLELESTDLTAKEVAIINKKAARAKKAVQDSELSAKKDYEKAALDMALDAAAESFGISQEVAMAKMLMAAPEVIAGSFKEAAKRYAPPVSIAMGALGAAGTVAPIIKGLADIKKNRFSKGGKTSGGTAGGSVDTSAISAATGAAGITTEAISSLAANNSARLGIDPSIGGAAGSAAANNVMGGASANVVFSESSYQSFQNQVNFREELTTVGG
jgi:hypothetical protein